METVRKFEANGNTYEVKKYTFKDKIDSNGGAAPWMIGRTVKNSKMVLFINGEDICTCSYNSQNAESEIIEIGKMFGY